MPPRDDEVQTLVEQLSAELERSVLVDDASLRLLAYSPTLGGEDEVRRTAILTRETPRAIRDLHFAQGIASATEPVRTAPRPRSALRCTAVTSSRSPGASASCGCSTRCSGQTPPRGTAPRSSSRRAT